MRLTDPPPVQDANRDELLLKAAEVQRILKLSRANVYRLMKSEVLPTVRIRGAVRVPYHALLKWIESHTRPGAKPAA